MRRLVVSEFVSLDMVFEDPGGSEKTKNGGWSFDFSSPEGMKYKADELKRADSLLLGRITYEGFAEAWPRIGKKDGFSKKMNEMPKHVVSSTIGKLNWENSSFVKGDLVEGIRKLKKPPGKDILVFGSGQLVRFLLDKNLVDKLCLMMHPVILGSGKLLLGTEERKNLKLITVKKLPAGTLIVEYEPSKK